MKIITVFLTFLTLAINCTHSFCSSASDDYYYENVKKTLKKYQRPFTFMQLQASKSNLSFTIAQKYDNAVCVMIDHRDSDDLFNACHKHNADNVVLLSAELSSKDLARFGECEHIDVVFSNDVTKRYKDWKDATEALLTFGDFIYLETPGVNSPLYEKVSAYFKDKKGELIAKAPGNLQNSVGDIYMFPVQKKYLYRRRWNYLKECRIGEYTIKSSFTEKKLIKEKTRPAGYAVTDWSAGINLFTFKKLHGLYPVKEVIRSLLMPMGNLQHNDLRIFNIIIQGKKLIPIDCNENGRTNTAKDLLPYILSQFRKKNINLYQAYDSTDFYLETIDNALCV